ncbi:hypothetical protein D3C78_1226620 [compost metagenome]
MSDIPPAHRTFPETAHHLLARNVSPSLIDIPFICAFIDHDWLSPALTPFAGHFRRFVDISTLQAAVSDPRFSEIVRRPAIMVGDQMTVRIVTGYNVGETFPILWFLRPHKIVFVRQRPPDIRVRG